MSILKEFCDFAVKGNVVDLVENLEKLSATQLMA